jgi:hypothetical protein
MATVEAGLQAQVRNIEATYGRSMDEWAILIRDRGLAKHGQIVSMLKSEFGLTHGAANRVALVALASLAPVSTGTDPIDALLAGRSGDVRAVFNRLMAIVREFGPGLEVAPKKGYVSLRRRTQFGMLQPASDRVDLGLILPGEPVSGRLESARSINALFTHRVRVKSVDDVDAELESWLRRAWDRAG